jgi:hypothetical protein
MSFIAFKQIIHLGLNYKNRWRPSKLTFAQGHSGVRVFSKSGVRIFSKVGAVWRPALLPQRHREAQGDSVGARCAASVTYVLRTIEGFPEELPTENPAKIPELRDVSTKAFGEPAHGVFSQDRREIYLR